MCLLLLALHRVPQRPWLLLGNRDEFHARPTAPAGPWEGQPHIIGGRDLAAGGSWLALNRNGRYAAVTNVRTAAQRPAPRSRGELVGEFVAGNESVRDYLARVAAHRGSYGPFNLVVGADGSAGVVSSIDGVPRSLGDGVHAFSNGSPSDDWPKMDRLRARFAALVDGTGFTVAAGANSGAASDAGDAALRDAALLDLLLDTAQPADDRLPNTGVGIDLERRLAPIFVLPLGVQGETYGTRASTLAYAHGDRFVLRERRFDAHARLDGESTLEVAREPAGRR